MKVEVYKERREHWKGDRKKERKETEETALVEDSEQYHFYTNPISSRAPV